MLGVFATLLLGFAPSYAVAQAATCVAGYAWSFNSQSQSPCEVASALRSVCAPGSVVSALPPGYVYIGPTVENRNECKCSSVYYSMLSACGICQTREIIRWSEHIANCTGTFLQSFPNPIPAELRVPHYAYLNVAEGDTFNATLARAAGGAETTGLPSATTLSPSASISSPGNTIYSTQTVSPGKKTNAGAIAGGVVGGLAFLGLVAGVVVWLLKRQPKPSAASTQYQYQHTLPSPAQMSYTGSSFNTNNTQRPLYNPNNPSTFPTSQDPRFGGTFQPSPSPHQPFITANYAGNAVPEL